MTEKKYDVIIVGGGPAGISCALWCRELGLSAILVEAGGVLGGQLNWTFNPIENHLGATASNGAELLEKFLVQVERLEIEVSLNSPVSKIDFPRRQVFLQDGRLLTYRSLVLATGVRRKTLDIPGEKELNGKGILFSGKKDRDLVKGKRAVVIGGGDAAFENAKILAAAAEKVFVINRSGRFRARAEFVKYARRSDVIEIFTNTLVTKICGIDWVDAVELENLETGDRHKLAADGVVIRIGVAPNSDICGLTISLDENGYIKTDSLGQTNLENVFAAGDIANPLAPTISGAVGMGATIAKVITYRES